MTQLVVPADIEQLLCDWLPGALATRGFASVAVSTVQPSAADSVTLYRTGGAQDDLMVLDRPQVTFDTRARLESRAAAIALMVKALVLQWNYVTSSLGGRQVYGVDDFGGPANLPDPNYTGARYRWTATIRIRSTVVTV